MFLTNATRFTGKISSDTNEVVDMDEMIPDSCMNCPMYIYKGDDEQFCRAKRLREITLQRRQKKPKWCPLERRRNEVPKVRG